MNCLPLKAIMVRIAAAIIISAVLTANISLTQAVAAAPETISPVSEGHLPVFEENRGQFDPRVRFVSRTGSSTVFLTDDEAVYVLPMARASETNSDSGSKSGFYAMRMRFAGGRALSSEGLGDTGRQSNYFRDSTATAGARSYREVSMQGVYPGVDVVWRGSDPGSVRYDLVLQPGVDPAVIELQFDGAHDLSVDDRGDLLVQTPAGTIRNGKLFTYQEIGGRQVEVTSRFVATGNSVRFDIGDHDPSLPLVIDPTVTLSNLAFSTFIGSIGDDVANDIAVDRNGSVYIAGRTTSIAFPTTTGVFDATANGAEDVFVTKFNSAGTDIVYSTFLGGPFFDEARGIAVNDAGEVYIAGTATAGFPTTAGAYDQTFNGGADVFVTKLSTAGSSLLYSTFIGASNIEAANDLAIDATGNAYIAVRASDAIVDYPTTAGAFDTTFNGIDDAAVTKINPTGSALVYSTFLGGSAIDTAVSIAVNSAGEAFVGGSATDAVTDFPTTPGAYDTTANGFTDFFATKISADGTALVYSTFIGGGDIDNPNAIAIDPAGNAYIGGTAGVGYPTTAGAFDTTQAGSNEAAISKISPDGSTLVYSTFLGGTQGESVASIAVDAAGIAYLACNNFGGDFPVTAGAYDPTFNGLNDPAITVLNQFGTGLYYSSYVGGGGTDSANDIAIDSAGSVYITGRTEFNAAPFPTSPEAFQTMNSTGSDAFVTKFGDFAIGGKVVDTTGIPLSNVFVALSGQVSGTVVTGADGRFGFTNTVVGEPHSVTATRSGYSFNPALFNIAALNNNRELVFVGAVGSPTGGSGGTIRVQDISQARSENGTFAAVTIARVGDLSSLTPVTVDVETVDGTAAAGVDYQPVSTVVSFGPFEASKTINIPLINDPVHEPKETFNVVLSNPTNNSEIETGRESTTVQILDEDLGNGDLVISEFRLRGKNGAKDEYIKLFNPNAFDVTVNAADNSAGLTLARAVGSQVEPVATVPNLVTIRAGGYYMFTNNSPSGGFSIIDYPTGSGGTTLTGDRTFTADIPDNADIVLLSTADPSAFGPGTVVDAAGFGASDWTSEGKPMAAIFPENSEQSFVRRLGPAGPVDTGNNAADLILVDGSATVFSSTDGKRSSVLGAPAPGNSDSLLMMQQDIVGFAEWLSPVWDPMPVENGRFGTYTVYRRVTNNSSEPIIALRLRAADFPTAGNPLQWRTSARPDFRLLDAPGDGRSILGTTVAAGRLQPAGGGINTTLTVDAVTAQSPLEPGQSVVVAIRFGVMRYGRFSFSAIVEAKQ